MIETEFDFTTRDFSIMKKLYSFGLAGLVTLLSLFIDNSTFAQTTDNYGCTGGPQYWVVPPCVTSIDVVMAGGEGGGSTGGSGATVTGTIPVVPGQTIEINVGCQGSCPSGTTFEGGGAGPSATGAGMAACSGGGLSSLEFPPYTMADAVMVAAGGGGMGGGTTDSFGGAGGCASGSTGGSTWGGPGSGGTSTAGGAGGPPWGAGGGGAAGGFGFGGAGAVDPCFNTCPGGGGGGGYYGGGGGGSDCWNGGGSKGGGGGGGGSSLTPGGGTCTAGNNTGDGFVSITYTPGVTAIGGVASAAPSPICEGDNVTLTLVGFVGSIQWQSAPTPAGPWTNIGGATTTPFVVAGVTANTCFRAEVTTPCPPAAFSTVACVTVDPLPTPANAGPDQAICGTTGTLAGNVPVDGSGSWTVIVGGSGVTTPTNPASGVTGLTAGTNTYTWTITSGVCPPSTDNITITAAFPVNAGADNGTSICNTAGSSVDLNPLLSGADPGGTWAETSGSGSFNPATGVLTTAGLAAGVYTFTYTMTGTFPCPDDVADFTVTVEQEVTAGLDNSTSACNNAGSSVDLNTLLTGADPGGAWAETSASGSFNSATGVLTSGGLAAGVYTFTYTVPAVAPCLPDVADFTVTVEQEANAGADNSTIACNSAGSTVDMNTLLTGADPGGVWAETSGSGSFNPATGIFTSAGVAAGVYTFTYTVTPNPPCVPDVANFTVTVSNIAQAGLDNTASICNDAGSSIDLNTLLVGADPGGAWAETSASGSFNPATGVFTSTGVGAGAYTFTYTVTPAAPCPIDVADFTITVEQEANAGLDNATTACNTAGSNVDLNTLLSGADPGGAWAETTASGSFNPATGIFTSAGVAAGVYTFTYTVTPNAPCPVDIADFTVTVSNLANAGLDNTSSICNDAGSTIDLNTLLSGADPGGTWAETSGSGSFNPATGVFTSTGVATGAYTFTYTVSPAAPCPIDVSDFTITVEQEANAGADNATTACNIGGSTVDMNTLLSGADPGGAWAETTASGAFDPATGIFTSGGLAAGAYTFTYTVTPNAPCPIDVADFTVTVSAAGNAGLDNSTSICNTAGSSVDMNTLLSGADAGGTWAETSASGSFTAGTGILDTDGLAAGAYTFTYTVSPAAPCPIDVSDFTVTVEQEAIAGPDNSSNLCNSAGSTLDLNTLLTGAAAGTWVETTGSGQFTPATGVFDASGLAPGVFSFDYTVVGVAPCLNDVATITITVTNLPDAGLDNSTQVCNTAGSTVDMNTLLSGADPGGTWAETTGSGSFNTATGIFTADSIPAGAYVFTYTLAASGPCPGDFSTFTVTVEQEVNAGLDNNTAICNTAGSSVDMNTLLSGADPGGSWAETSASGAFTPGTGVLNTDGLGAGAYTFTYTMTAVAPCINDISDFTVTVEQEVNAGLDNNNAICNVAGSSVDLNTLLSGADPGGTWSETTASGAFTPGTGILNTAGLTSGIYTFTYTMTGVAPCPNDVADFTVTVEQEVDAGVDNNTAICNTAGSTVDINTLLSGADSGGAFAETSGSGSFSAGTGILDTDGLAAGAYTFTYTMTGVAPCPNDVSNFTVTVEQEAIAGPDNSATMCNSAGSTLDLNTLLSGAAAGAWIETSASGQFTPATGVFDASGLATGAYTFTYTVTGVAPCIDDIADITVTVTNLPNAGLDGNAQICNVSGSTVDLNSLLSGADPGGSWTETTGSGSFDPGTGIFDTDGVPSGVYTFNYDLAAAGPCPGDQAVFTVTLEQEVDAGTDNSTAICNTAGSTVDMNTLLSGADPGGTWAETSGSGSFTPGTGILNTDGLGAGAYTFTYTMTAVAPCVNDVSDFTVTVEQEVNAGPNNTTSSCNTAGTFIDLNTILIGADPGGIWNELSSSGSFTPGTGMLDISGLSGGDYTFTYTMNAVAPCLTDVSTITVTIEEIPTVNPVTDEEVCDNDVLVSQTFTSTPAGATFNWSNISGTDVGFGFGGAGGSVGSFTGTTGSAGDVTVTVEVTPTSSGSLGCVGPPVTFDITVHPLPQIGFVANEYQGCEPLNVQFTNSFPGIPGSTCEWQFGDGSVSTTCDLTNHQYGTAGFYDVGLTVTTMYGCSDQVTFTDLIAVYPEAVADFVFSPTDITLDDTRVDFTNLSSNADSYTWEFGDGSANSSEVDPNHTYPEIGNVSYEVTLTAHSPGGCDDEITKLITIKDVIIFYVPNVFTPDGDQYNETFKPIMTAGVDVYDYHLTIFNRWGEVVFESYNKDYGWNGSYGNQGLVQDDVYVWQIEFGETMSDKKHKHRGHVTILK